MSFPKYEAYKDSGVEWLGEVPEHWTVSFLKNYISTINGFGFSSSDFQDEGVPFIRAGNIKNKSITQPEIFLPDEVVQQYERVILEGGDIVISMVGSDPKIIESAVGQIGIVPDALAGSVPNQNVVILRGNDDFLSKRFVFYSLLSNAYRHHLNVFSHKLANQSIISSSFLVSAKFSCPDLEEQSQIAHFLDHETARIDALIAEQQRLIELLKEKRQAVISHAVTKGLDPTAPMKDSGVEWLGEVPAHWDIKSYRYSSEIYRGKFGHRPRNDPSLYDGEFAFIQTGDIARAKKYINTYKQTLNEKGASVSQKFPAGTLVMAIAANIGDTAILGFEAYAPDSVVGFKPKNDIELEFLRFSLMAAIQELHKTSTQSTQANLNIDRIGSVRAVFPSLTEQRRIIQYLNHELERYSELVEQATKTIELMQERRSALISAAVTGKIDVRGWQAPASASPAPTLVPDGRKEPTIKG